MDRTPFPKYESCPCGSGQKYKFCCYTKGFHYYVEEATGDVLREVPVSSEARAVMDEALVKQREKFVAKFGREPGPEDPVFFDMPPDDELRAKSAEAMRAAGIRPALIYAHEKTGLIVTTENRRMIPNSDLEEWDEAVAEYYELHPSENPNVD